MGGTRMTLEQYIEKSGYKIGYIATCLGLTYVGFRYKVIGKNKFTVTEALLLQELLNISDEDFKVIFSDKSVQTSN